MKNHSSLKQLTLASLLSVVVLVFTYIGVQFPLFGAAGGYTHLGTLAMFIIAAKYGKHYGFIAAAIGMTLFDITGGWFAWAPATFIIRLAAGYIFGLLSQSSLGQGKSFKNNLVALLAGGVIIIVGYYVFEALFITDFISATASIIGNILQIVIASLGLLMIKSLPDLEN
jgi:uncharacterized membrane protein